MRKIKQQSIVTILITAFLLSHVSQSLVSACTGITLKAKDGSVVYGRTLEWGSLLHEVPDHDYPS